MTSKATNVSAEPVGFGVLGRANRNSLSRTCNPSWASPNFRLAVERIVDNTQNGSYVDPTIRGLSILSRFAVLVLQCLGVPLSVKTHTRLSGVQP